MCVIAGFQQQTAEYSGPQRGRVSALSQLEEELLLLDRSNTQLQLTISELRLKLRAKDAELRKEMQKVSTCPPRAVQGLMSSTSRCVVIGC